MRQTHFIGNYDYSNTSLEKIRNTSSLDIISNMELRAIDHHEERYGPILSNYLPRPYQTGFKDPRAKLDFLGSIEFESLVKYREKKINTMFRAVEQSQYPKNIKEVINWIIELSRVE